MNKPASFPKKDSLIERASELYDFGAALSGKGLPPVNIPASLIPPAPVPQPVAPVVITEPVATPAVVVRASESAPVVAAPPVPRFIAADWVSGTTQSVDSQKMRRAGYLVPNAEVNGLSEEFRIIKREILAGIRGSNTQKPIANGNVILVASAHTGEGKTYCAVNLAVSLAAETDLEVLLVDADIAKPGVIEAFGLQDGPGLMDRLTNPNVPLDQCIIRTDANSLFVMPSGATTNRDAEFLASSRMPELIEQLVSGRPNRVVIFDSPPLLAATPAAILAANVGQTIMVVRADQTSEAALRDAAHLLSGCSHVRLLLNGVKFSASGRRFGSYYGKGAKK
jgi:protein-tyrosine kinase